MGKSPKPINIYVTDRSYLEWDVLKELHEKGNQTRAIQLKPNTLILGPMCHRLLPGMEKYVEVALKSARQNWTPVISMKPSTKKVKRSGNKKTKETV